jgi:hypothetical protein
MSLQTKSYVPPETQRNMNKAGAEKRKEADPLSEDDEQDQKSTHSSKPDVDDAASESGVSAISIESGDDEPQPKKAPPPPNPTPKKRKKTTTLVDSDDDGRASIFGDTKPAAHPQTAPTPPPEAVEVPLAATGKGAKDPTKNPKNYKFLHQYLHENPFTRKKTLRSRFYLFVSPLVRKKYDGALATFASDNIVAVELTVIIEDPTYSLERQMAKLIAENLKGKEELDSITDPVKKAAFKRACRLINYTNNDDRAGNLGMGYETITTFQEACTQMFNLYGKTAPQFSNVVDEKVLAQAIAQTILPLFSEEVFQEQCKKLGVFPEQLEPLSVRKTDEFKFIDDLFVGPEKNGVCYRFPCPSLVTRIPLTTNIIPELMQTRFWWSPVCDLIMLSDLAPRIDTIDLDLMDADYYSRLLSMAQDKNKRQSELETSQDHYFIVTGRAISARAKSIHKALVEAQKNGNEVAEASLRQKLDAVIEQMKAALCMGLDYTQKLPDSIKAILKFKDENGAFFYHDIHSLNISFFGNMMARLYRKIAYHGNIAHSTSLIMLFMISSMGIFENTEGETRLNPFIVGEPGSGKSHAASRFMKLLQPGMYSRVGYASEKAMFVTDLYKSDNRVLVYDELPPGYMKHVSEMSSAERETANATQTAMTEQRINTQRVQAINNKSGDGSKRYILQTTDTPDHNVRIFLSNFDSKNEAFADRTHKEKPTSHHGPSQFTIADYSAAPVYQVDEANWDLLRREFGTIHLANCLYDNAVTLGYVPKPDETAICEPIARVLFQVLKRRMVEVDDKVRALGRFISTAKYLKKMKAGYFLGSELSPLRKLNEDGTRVEVPFDPILIVDTMRDIIMCPDEEIAIAAAMLMLNEFIAREESDMAQAILSVLCGFHPPHVIAWTLYADYMETLVAELAVLERIEDLSKAQRTLGTGSDFSDNERAIDEHKRRIASIPLPFNERDDIDPMYAPFAIQASGMTIKFRDNIVSSIQKNKRGASGTERHSITDVTSKAVVEYQGVRYKWVNILATTRAEKVPYQPGYKVVASAPPPAPTAASKSPNEAGGGDAAPAPPPPKKKQRMSTLADGGAIFLQVIKEEKGADDKVTTSFKLDPMYVKVNIDNKTRESSYLATFLVNSLGAFKRSTGIEFPGLTGHSITKRVALFIENLKKMRNIEVFDLPLQDKIDELTLGKILRPSEMQKYGKKTAPVILEFGGDLYVNIFLARMNRDLIEREFLRSVVHKGTRKRRVVIPTPHPDSMYAYCTEELAPRQTPLVLKNPRYITEKEEDLIFRDPWSTTPYVKPDSNDRDITIDRDPEQFYADRIQPWYDGKTYNPECMPARLQARFEELYNKTAPYTLNQVVKICIYPDEVIQSLKSPPPPTAKLLGPGEIA